MTRRFDGSGGTGSVWVSWTNGRGAVSRTATGGGATSTRGGGLGDCCATGQLRIGAGDAGASAAARGGSGALQFLHSFRMLEFTVWQLLQRTSLASMRDLSKERRTHSLRRCK